MSRTTRCGQAKVELVHKQITPVQAKSLYEEAIATGAFIGTFKQYQDYIRGSVSVSEETGNWVINGVDSGIKAETEFPAPQSDTEVFE